MLIKPFLYIASANALALQPQSLCSAAIKSLDVANFPPTNGARSLGTSQEFTKAESEALIQYYCSKDPTCSSKSKGIKEMSSAPEDTVEEAAKLTINERMSRNSSSVELFSWGYQIYVPSSVVQRMTDAVSAKCSILTGPIDWCNANDQTQDKPIGVVVFCSLITGPLFTCNKFIDQIKAFDRNSEGVILRATWAKAASPIIQSASELLADA